MKKNISSGKCMNNNKMIYIALIFAVAVVLGSVMYVFNPLKMYERFGNESSTNIEYFYMETCPHCVEFTPVWDKVSKMSEYQHISFKKYEISANKERSSKFNITSAPTVIAVDKKSDMVVGKFTDERTDESLSKFISTYK